MLRPFSLNRPQLRKWASPAWAHHACESAAVAALGRRSPRRGSIVSPGKSLTADDVSPHWPRLKKYLLILALLLLTFSSASAGPLLPGTYYGSLPINPKPGRADFGILLGVHDETTGFVIFGYINEINGELRHLASGDVRTNSRGRLHGPLRRGQYQTLAAAWLRGKVSDDGSVITGRIVYLFPRYGSSKQHWLVHRFVLHHRETIPALEAEVQPVPQ